MKHSISVNWSEKIISYYYWEEIMIKRCIYITEIIIQTFTSKRCPFIGTHCHSSFWSLELLSSWESCWASTQLRKKISIYLSFLKSHDIQILSFSEESSSLLTKCIRFNILLLKHQQIKIFAYMSKLLGLWLFTGFLEIVIICEVGSFECKIQRRTDIFSNAFLLI